MVNRIVKNVLRKKVEKLKRTDFLMSFYVGFYDTLSTCSAVEYFLHRFQNHAKKVTIFSAQKRTVSRAQDFSQIKKVFVQKYYISK